MFASDYGEQAQHVRSDSVSGCCTLLWHTDGSDNLVADARELRLVVNRRSDSNRGARFMILRRAETSESPAMLIASGFKENVREAMQAGEREAVRSNGPGLRIPGERIPNLSSTLAVFGRRAAVESLVIAPGIRGGLDPIESFPDWIRGTDGGCRTA